jgi:hypothetical protein
VLRPYLLARRERLNATAAFATIIIERLIDVATVLVLFGFFVLFVPAGAVTGDPGQLAYVKFWGGLASAGAVLGMVVLFALAGHPERLGRAAFRIERVLPARIAAVVASFVETFAQGLAVMRSPPGRSARIVISVVVDDCAADLADLAGVSYTFRLQERSSWYLSRRGRCRPDARSDRRIPCGLSDRGHDVLCGPT